jgi:alpha-mannosidase
MKKLHLICNAHIDPVWLWEWPEGAAEAISTFRVAAELCEQFDAFVFNHNEALLYQWVEEYEPALFKQIQQLVQQGKWHIMGGWYLQPDCNMPSGESFVRQILLGRRYFEQKFGVRPTTAINFDPFGHSRGLVQILAKSGYDSYLFCRPNQEDCPLPAEDFSWVGFDGSSVTAHRSLEFYNSPLGKAAQKVTGWLQKLEGSEQQVGLLLWGVGNHGGGPSRLDLEQLQALIEKTDKEGLLQIRHSTPEAYFQDLRESQIFLPRHKGALNAWAVGCYTSQVLIKQRHRQLENELFLTEKMLSSAAIQGLLDYPLTDLQSVMRDLAFAEFHDILPGSSIQPVETAALRLMDHGLEILSRLKTRAFFALASGQPRAREGFIPVLVYNPHPFKIETIIECEFQLADQNWEETFSSPVVYQGENRLACQTEQELSNLNLDWRKRVVFRAELLPSQMNRFDCALEVLPARPTPTLPVEGQHFVFRNAELQVLINRQTGLVDRYRVNGIDFLKPNAFLPLVVEDNEDSWGMTTDRFNRVVGAFSLMENEAGSDFSGIHGTLDPVRVIEDGSVRSVVEAVFAYGSSFICQRYKLPKAGSEMELELVVYWNEKNRMLKLAVPTLQEELVYLGQVAYGVEELATDGREVVAQKWVAVVAQEQNLAFSCINEGSYGSDFDQQTGELRLSLLRSPGYAAHPIGTRPIMPQDRFSPRIDQGERHFRFWFKAGTAQERRENLDREALVHNEKPFALSFFPAGTGQSPESVLSFSDNLVQLAAFKQAEDGSGDYILRLFEPTGHSRSTVLKSKYLKTEQQIELGPYELKTLRLNATTRTLSEVNLLEHL